MSLVWLPHCRWTRRWFSSLEGRRQGTRGPPSCSETTRPPVRLVLSGAIEIVAFGEGEDEGECEGGKDGDVESKSESHEVSDGIVLLVLNPPPPTPLRLPSLSALPHQASFL